MDPSTMYLTAFLIIGGIIFLVLFLPLCTVLLVAVRQSIGSKHLAGTTFPDAHP